jgi:hypothetical protein
LTQSTLEVPVPYSRNAINWTLQSSARDGRRREPLEPAARSAPCADGRDVTMRDPFGRVKLEALSVPDVWHAPTALALYAVGPRSTVTVALNVAGLRAGDIAGLALFDRPYAWIGAERGRAGLTLARFEERGGTACRVRIDAPRVWLQAECDFVRNQVRFRYSTDGRTYVAIGRPRPAGRTPGAAHGIECALFSCSTKPEAEGGHAEFDSFLMVTEFSRPTPGLRP